MHRDIEDSATSPSSRFLSHGFLHVGCLILAGAAAVWSFDFVPPAEDKVSAPAYFESSLHDLTMGDCRAAVERIGIFGHNGTDVRWVWTEQTSAAQKIEWDQRAVGSVAQPRPYAATSAEVLSGACSFRRNSVYVVTADHAFSFGPLVDAQPVAPMNVHYE